MRRADWRRWLWIPLAIACVAPHVAAGDVATGASASDDAVTQKARDLFVEGRRLFQEGKLAEARASLVAAWRIHEHYSIAANLGVCELKLGNPRDAAEYLAFALRAWPEGHRDAEREKIDKSLREASTKVGTLEVSVEPAGATIWVDGQRRGTAPLPGKLYVAPGRHVVTATMPGNDPMESSVDVSAGETETVHLTVKTQPSADPAPAPIPPKSAGDPPVDRDHGTETASADSARTPVLIGGLALTGLALGTAVVFKLRASAAQDDVDESKARAIESLGRNCASTTEAPACADLSEATDRRNSSHQVGNVALVATGVFAVATTATFLLWPRESKEVTATPAASSSFVGVNLAGSF